VLIVGCPWNILLVGRLKAVVCEAPLLVLLMFILIVVDDGRRFVRLLSFINVEDWI
jgi:hypothetical protein